LIWDLVEPWRFSDAGNFALVWFGSEQKAKDAVLYHYKHAASGFSAKLTPQQVEELKSESPFHIFSCD
jgi:hypothetical protein